MDKEQALQALNRILLQLEKPETILKVWESNATAILKTIFPDRNLYLPAVRTIVLTGSSDFINRKEYKQFIRGFINEIEDIGVPQQKIETPTNQFNIAQSLNLNIIIIDYLKNELTTEQINELKEAFISGKDPEEKKQKLYEKLKNFGSDLASNILANILTNPIFWNF